jgi:hypothetical protein
MDMHNPCQLGEGIEGVEGSEGSEGFEGEEGDGGMMEKLCRRAGLMPGTFEQGGKSNS